MLNISPVVCDFRWKIHLKPVTANFLLLECNNVKSTGLIWVKHDMIGIHCIFG